MAEFLHMGGYAGYIWPAFGLVAAVLGALLGLSLREMKARERELRALQDALGKDGE